MAFELKTEIIIHSSPEKIWSILTDFDNYPNWNPFVTSLTGDVKVGNTIQVRIEPPGASVNKFQPIVTSVEPNKKLSWLGVVLFRGFFDGEHIFKLTDNGNGTLSRLAFWLYNYLRDRLGSKFMRCF